MNKEAFNNGCGLKKETNRWNGLTRRIRKVAKGTQRINFYTKG
jgi:hypothetical protein